MRKKYKYLLLAILVTSGPVASLPAASAASSSVCNSLACDNPYLSTVFDRAQDRPLVRLEPVTICEILNNWKVDAVIQVVGGILKVNWVYTLIPSVVCHLVG